MTRKIQLILFFFAITLKSFAQLTDGSTAPDWTMKDITGKVWHLYELTAQGKTVFIDVSATWCHPCWNYHNTGWLDSLYEQHGPNGKIDQSCYVFLIEGDARTNSYDLHGKGSRTAGDWTAHTSYPIIDPGADTISPFDMNYNIQFYPTVYMVCPDNKIYQPGQVDDATLVKKMRETTCAPAKPKETTPKKKEKKGKKSPESNLLGREFYDKSFAVRRNSAIADCKLQD